MSTYDIVMLAVLIGAVLFGYWKGLSWQVASLASVIASYFVAMNFHGLITPMLGLQDPLNKFAAMLILFLLTALVIWLAYGYVRETIGRWRLQGFDHQLGAVVGAFKGALLCMLITLFSVTLLPDSFQNSVINSRSGNFIARGINQLSVFVPDEIHAVLGPRLNEMNETLAQHGFDPTAPITMDNRDGWFVGQPVLNSQEPFGSNVQTYQGQFQLPTRDKNGGWPNTNIQINTRDLIDRSVENISQGFGGNANH